MAVQTIDKLRSRMRDNGTRPANALPSPTPQNTGGSGFGSAMSVPTGEGVTAASDPMAIAGNYLSEDNRAMRLAATKGRQYANSRGLLNSSVAAGASMDAMAGYATDLAKTRSGQIATGELAKQGFGFNTALQAQQGAQQMELQRLQGSQAMGLQELQGTQAMEQLNTKGQQAVKLQKMQGATQVKLQGMQGAQQINLQKLQGQQAKELSAQEAQQKYGLIGAQADANIRQMEAQGKQDLLINKQQFGFNKILQGEKLLSDKQLAQFDAQTRKDLMGMESDMRVKLQSMSGDQEKFKDASSMLQQVQSNFQNEFNTIMSNPNLSADDRNALMRSAVDRVTTMNNFVGSLYDMPIDWNAGDFTLGNATNDTTDTTGGGGDTSSGGGGGSTTGGGGYGPNGDWTYDQWVNTKGP